MNPKQPEITWSLMHPTPLDVDYMRKVVEHIPGYRVDSFEICADCHSPLGGLDGLVLYEDYPATAAAIDREGILNNRLRLKEILKVAHDAGRPVYYWHREVTVCPGLLEAMPGLLDQHGEFDLLGETFGQLLRYKITKAFEAVPELDGVVLTLTEADYSVIHNSNTAKYPPDQVVAHIVRIFAEEHQKRNKRFVLRSFGSIAQDYEDILAGAAIAAKQSGFEIETKITPYDFDPFLPVNPFLRRIPGTTMSAECDCLGEFLGAGCLPAENVDNIVRYVRTGLQAGVDRFAIRVDRVGNNIFDNYEINLFAYQQAIDHPDATAESIRADWSKAHYPAPCQEALTEMGKQGFELVAHTNFIDGNVIFHQFPLGYDMKILKAGGIFGVFKNGVDLHMLNGIWSILADRKTPGRDAILAEKAQAVAIAEKQLEILNHLELDSSPYVDEFNYRRRLWNNAQIASKSIQAFVKCVCAYFDDMETGLEFAPHLNREIEQAVALLQSMRPNEDAVEVRHKAFVNGMDHNVFRRAESMEDVYLNPLISICNLLKDEYQAEFTARRIYGATPGLVDLVICGGLTDEWRIGRYMHASHSMLKEGLPMRWAGNRVFPNGFLDFELKRPAGKGKIIIYGINDESPLFTATVDGVRKQYRLDDAGQCEILFHPGEGVIKLRLEKATDVYPQIRAVAVIS